MTPESLQQAVANAGLAAIGFSFLAGLLFSFNPVALASIPVSLAYVTKAREKKQAVLFGAMFIVGMLLVHAAMGFVAGLGLEDWQKIDPKRNQRQSLSFDESGSMESYRQQAAIRW